MDREHAGTDQRTAGSSECPQEREDEQANHGVHEDVRGVIAEGQTAEQMPLRREGRARHRSIEPSARAGLWPPRAAEGALPVTRRDRRILHQDPLVVVCETVAQRIGIGRHGNEEDEKDSSHQRRLVRRGRGGTTSPETIAPVARAASRIAKPLRWGRSASLSARFPFHAAARRHSDSAPRRSRGHAGSRRRCTLAPVPAGRRGLRPARNGDAWDRGSRARRPAPARGRERGGRGLRERPAGAGAGAARAGHAVRHPDRNAARERRRPDRAVGAADRDERRERSAAARAGRLGARRGTFPAGRRSRRRAAAPDHAAAELAGRGERRARRLRARARDAARGSGRYAARGDARPRPGRRRRRSSAASRSCARRARSPS